MSDSTRLASRRAFLGAAAVSTGATIMSTEANAADLASTQPTLFVRPLLNGISTPEAWAKKRETLAATIRRYLGELKPFEKVEPRVSARMDRKRARQCAADAVLKLCYARWIEP